jgi:hypothetical protein
MAASHPHRQSRRRRRDCSRTTSATRSSRTGMPAIWPKGSCRPETPPRLGARLRSGRPPAHRRRRGRQCRGGSRRDESDFVAVASAAGFLIQIGSAPCAVSNHAAVAFAEWRGDVGLRGCASAARARWASRPRCSSGERRALEELGARGVRGAGQFSPCAGRSTDHRRDPRRAVPHHPAPRSHHFFHGRAGDYER